MPVYQKIKFFRNRIPVFECIPGCHDCCGPVTASSHEASELPAKDETQHAEALSNWSCTYLGAGGCTVYDDRPLICRLFGATPDLLCPRGRRPENMVDPLIGSQIQQFFLDTRQVLI